MMNRRILPITNGLLSCWWLMQLSSLSLINYGNYMKEVSWKLSVKRSPKNLMLRHKRIVAQTPGNFPFIILIYNCIFNNNYNRKTMPEKLWKYFLVFFFVLSLQQIGQGFCKLFPHIKGRRTFGQKYAIFYRILYLWMSQFRSSLFQLSYNI